MELKTTYQALLYPDSGILWWQVATLSFDVYRIDGLWDMDDLGYEEYFYGEGVCLVEWGSMIKELFPENTIYVRIEKDLEKGFDYRKITVSKDF